MGLPEAWGGPGQWDGRNSDQRRGRPCGRIAWVVCERPCAWQERATQPPPRLPASYGPAPPIFPFSFITCLPLFWEPCPHPHLPHPPASAGGGCSSLPALLPFLSPVLSWLSLQLPADRVRQVRPVLRAPGPPSTSNQIPPTPRGPPIPSLPGQLFCDLTAAPPAPKPVPFICDLVCCSGELTHPDVMLVKTCAPLWYCSCDIL